MWNLGVCPHSRHASTCLLFVRACAHACLCLLMRVGQWPRQGKANSFGSMQGPGRAHPPPQRLSLQRCPIRRSSSPSPPAPSVTECHDDPPYTCCAQTEGRSGWAAARQRGRCTVLRRGTVWTPRRGPPVAPQRRPPGGPVPDAALGVVASRGMRVVRRGLQPGMHGWARWLRCTVASEQGVGRLCWLPRDFSV